MSYADALIPLRDVGPLVGCRDPRTIHRRLLELGVPVTTFGGRRYVVEAGDVLRARRVHAVVESFRISGRSAGVTLPPGSRLWDSQPDQRATRRAAA